MPILFNATKMQELMHAFYSLSGIRFVLFDAEFHEVTAYPPESCDFCRMMKSHPKTRRKCDYADRRSFKKCTDADSPTVYRCHAGLAEAVIPLHENDITVGYLMFGQIAADGAREVLREAIPRLAAQYGFDEAQLRSAVEQVRCKTAEEIDAAAKIMEACTGYVMFKELVAPDSDRIFDAAKSYIEEHLGEEFSVEALCEAVGVGRTRLYDVFRKQARMGVAEYLRRRRLHRAKKLLKTTERSITDIADAVGFGDYAYFGRLYKRQYGVSPLHYRKHHS